MTIGAFLKTHGVYVEGEEEDSGENANDAGNIDGNDDDDDFSDDEEFIGEYEDDILHGDVNQFMETNNVEGTPKSKKTRGNTMCAKIHTRSWEEREEVIFHEGQVIGPTERRVKDLTYFIGTMGRRSDFITLMYTSWKVVPLHAKKRIWKYIRSKFIIPREGKKWVMIGVQEAWKRYKARIKKKHFDIYNNIEDMLKNRPSEIPETQFRKLIAYWSIPSVQAMCRVNSQNCKKQQHQHRMGPISFARVRNEMREMNENKESPSQVDVFIATRIGRKGKELDLETQAVVDKLKHHQEAGDTPEDSFCAVFGKENPGRVRCYGRAVTKTSLQKEQKIAKIKQQHTEKFNSLQTELHETKTELHETKDRIQNLESLVKLLLQQSSGLNIEETLSFMRSKEATSNSAQGVNGNNGETLFVIVMDLIC